MKTSISFSKMSLCRSHHFAGRPAILVENQQLLIYNKNNVKFTLATHRADIFKIMKMTYSHGLRHYGVHVHDSKCICTSKYIVVSRGEYKLHTRNVTMSTDSIIKCYKNKRNAHF